MQLQKKKKKTIKQCLHCELCYNLLKFSLKVNTRYTEQIHHL